MTRRSLALSEKLQQEFVGPLDDLLNILSASGESIAPETQLYAVFKLTGPKMYQCVGHDLNREEKRGNG